MKQVVLALLLFPLALIGQSGRECLGIGVHEDNGNVFVQCDSGETVPITAGGRSAKPFLSPSGRYVVFLERHPPEGVEIRLAQQSKGWIAETLVAFPSSVDGSIYHDVIDYRPLNVGCGVLVLADYSATTFMLLRASCEPRRLTKVCTASAARQLRSGPFKGDVAVLSRVPAPPGDPLGRVVRYVYQIVTPEGAVERSIGEDARQLRDFLGFDPDLWPPRTGAPER